MPALAGILLVVAYNMSEWRLFARLLRAARGDVLVCSPRSSLPCWWT